MSAKWLSSKYYLCANVDMLLLGVLIWLGIDVRLLLQYGCLYNSNKVLFLLIRSWPHLEIKECIWWTILDGEASFFVVENLWVSLVNLYA